MGKGGVAAALPFTIIIGAVGGVASRKARHPKLTANNANGLPDKNLGRR